MGCPAPCSTRAQAEPDGGPKMCQQAVIGLIGGMSWESSAEDYRIINREVRNRLGGVHSARSLMWSVDFGEIERLQHQGDWVELTDRMKDAAIRLQRGGADFILLCTNTMHLMADAVADAIDVPLLHIADPTAERIKAAGFQKVGLLGTAFTMEQDFYKGRLERVFGLDVLVPDADDRRVVHEVIYRELVAGEIRPESRIAYREIIARLVAAGAEAIILGCTEIMLLVSPEDSAVPMFDTTTIHAIAAVDRALAPTPVAQRRATNEPVSRADRTMAGQITKS
jgi:aspartate racemase